MRRKRSRGPSEPTGLEDELAVLRRTGRPVLVRRNGRVVGALITLDDLREHLGSTPELSVQGDASERPKADAPGAPSPTGKLEALRELRDLAVQSD